MTKCKTLYISDLDGTLLDEHSSLSEYTMNTLNKLIASGIDFTIATGRIINAAKHIMADVNLNTPMITFNGGVIYDTKNQRYLKIYCIPIEAVKNIISVLQSFSISVLMYELKNDNLISYYESLDQKFRDFVEDRKKRFHIVFNQVQNLHDVISEHILCFSLADTYDRVKPIFDALSDIPGISLSLLDYSSNHNLWSLDIVCSDISKQSAINYLRETYGYEKVIGFGDNLNDIPMFQACDVSVAVCNAHEDLIAAADEICLSNLEDGVVKWIEHQIQTGLE